MVVAHNLASVAAQRHLNIVTGKKAKNNEKLASGYRINRAADDAAGLTISENMRRQIRGLDKGAQNIQDGISLIQVADGALSEVHSLLHRMTELSVQAANDTNTDEDRQAIQKELNSIVVEIDRIGTDTTFNTKHIFQVPEAESYDGSITQLVKCPEADKGYLLGSYAVNGGYYPAATMDYSNVTAKNIQALNGAGFSFTCSQSCAEVFNIKFKTDGDGTQSTATNLSGKVPHYYTIDISNCKNGTEVVNTAYGFIANNLPTSKDDSKSYGDLGVSHSNNLAKNGATLTVYANSNKCSTEEAAKKYFESKAQSGSPYSKILCDEIKFEGEQPDFFNEYNIQCSSNAIDNLKIRTHQLDNISLGLTNLSVSNYTNAGATMEKVKGAVAMVSDWRSELGAYQNRLEYSYNSNRNISENTQAAESLIRDTDIASLMVEYSKNGILEQAGMAMISQANSNQEMVLSLLS